MHGKGNERVGSTRGHVKMNVRTDPPQRSEIWAQLKGPRGWRYESGHSQGNYRDARKKKLKRNKSDKLSLTEGGMNWGGAVFNLIILNRP